MFKPKKTRETIKIEELKPHSKNPKLHDVKLISKSIENLGFVDDIVVDENNVILGGHGRIKALKELGEKEVEVIRISNWTEEQKEKYLLVANQTTMLGGLDDEMLKGFDKEVLDFSGFDSDILISPEEKDDEVPEVPEEPISKLGDLYELGNHRVLCGDSTKIEDVEKLMDGKKADMVFTDPPYNVDYGGEQSPIWKQNIEKIKNDNLTPQEWKMFCEKIVTIISSFTSGNVYVCHAPGGDGRVMAQCLDEVLHWSATVIWKKDRLIPGRAHYQRIYEPIWYGWVKGGSHKDQEDRKETDVWEEIKNIKSSFDGEYTTIKFSGYQVRIKGKAEGFVKRKKQKIDFWQFDRPFKNDLHPTMKPVALTSNAILNSSKKEGTVLDTFLGSGSTLIASEKTGRKCYGMELDPKYIDVIVQRYCEYTGNYNIIKNGKPIVWQKKT
jgi:DNA modification methylase